MSPPVAAPDRPASPLQTRKRPVALVVDDDPHVRMLTAMIMETSGWIAVTARNGETALRMIEEHEPNIVLLDIALPRMSGLEVLRLVKSDAWHGPRPRIMLVSGYVSLVSQADRLLADAVLGKPFDFDSLVCMAERAVARLHED
jgi:CheY-like chemotaxis protein